MRAPREPLTIAGAGKGIAFLMAAGFPAFHVDAAGFEVCAALWTDVMSDVTDAEVLAAVVRYTRDATSRDWPTPGMIRAVHLAIRHEETQRLHRDAATAGRQPATTAQLRARREARGAIGSALPLYLVDHVRQSQDELAQALGAVRGVARRYARLVPAGTAGILELALADERAPREAS